MLGFGCTVPAYHGLTGALENKRDRFKVMLVTPFMSCNARLTIYILFSEMFFPKKRYGSRLFYVPDRYCSSYRCHSCYASFDRKKVFNYLLIELPEYKLPDSRTVGI